MAPKSESFFSQKQLKTMVKKTNKTENFIQSQVMLDGSMIIARDANGLHTADFECCEINVEMKPFIAKCKVQCMRDGNVYVTELPKRVRNTPIFREDNSSLSLGQDGRYYFCFSMPETQVARLPRELVRQASVIAQKMKNKTL